MEETPQENKEYWRRGKFLYLQIADRSNLLLVRIFPLLRLNRQTILRLRSQCSEGRTCGLIRVGSKSGFLVTSSQVSLTWRRFMWHANLVIRNFWQDYSNAKALDCFKSDSTEGFRLTPPLPLCSLKTDPFDCERDQGSKNRFGIVPNMKKSY